MAKPIELKNRVVWMEGSYSSTPIMLKNARVSEGLSKLTETTIEFFSTKRDVDLQDLLGSEMILGQKLESGERFFTGTCISVEYLGKYQDADHFVAECRPWLWFLTRTKETRIFQQKTAVDIITEILGDYGFSSNLEKNSVSGSYLTRTYCVQYRETDFAFISRLMEEEGIYYYFKQQDRTLKLVLCDSIAAHKPNPDGQLKFYFPEKGSYRRKDDHIFDWAQGTQARSGKVTLTDYDFERPSAELKSAKNIQTGSFTGNNKEIYDYPGHMRSGSVGDAIARVKMQAEAVKHLLSRGECNIRTMGVGQTFKVDGHPRVKKTDEHLVVTAVHHLRIDDDYVEEQTKKPVMSPALDQEGIFDNTNKKDTYRCTFEVIPKTEPFRAPQVTPWPGIPGMHTAVVTGPSGEEIYTDEYGRIKVQFHWDRLGKKDEKTTCWVRCVMPWSGKNWGMISIPRIGQEVAIMFEEGDPDRPICTGMLYNGENKPPYALDANKTQTGIVTRSTKSGSADTYHELIFEDKKDAEFVRLQSERDYKETIKNNAEITIGLEHKDKGDLTQTIHRNKTETLNTGDHKFTVKDGNQTIFVKKNHEETIEGKSDQTITGNTTQTIKTGNQTHTVKTGKFDQTIQKDYKQTIKMGNMTQTLDMGNLTQVMKLGNHKMDVKLGKSEVSAMQSIEFKVGTSSIKIDPMGVTIKGMMIKIEGTAMCNVKAPMTDIKGSALVMVKGGITMIN